MSIVAALTGCAPLATSPRPDALPIVNAGGEKLRGAAVDTNVVVFRGVPFAAPPVNALRWKAPQPHEPREGIQDATAFGPACPQDQGNPQWYRNVARRFGADPTVVPTLTEVSEDCLYLNVWTETLAAQSPRPVMVWIHGGSNVNGYAFEPNYLGHNLAAKGVVLVSINYRLGPFGFMAHPALNAEDANGVSGYYGLADQVAALRWIKSNIASFGGDPSNVTVFGASAGGSNIHALMRMPSAAGLFHKAIIQSGALSPDDSISFNEAVEAGKQLVSRMGATTTDEMRELEWKALFKQHSADLSDFYFGPITDGIHLLEENTISPRPLLVGANKDEWFMYLKDDSVSSLSGALSDHTGSNDSKVQQYLDDKFDNVRKRANHLLSAAEYLCPALSLAKNVSKSGHTTYAYYFTRVRPNGDELLAYHGAEIPYVFDTADDWLPTDEIDQRLTETMVTYWTNFARNGDPNSEKLPYWPRYDADDSNVFDLGNDVKPVTGNPAKICTLLDKNE